jgi:hypothetical protein
MLSTTRPSEEFTAYVTAGGGREGANKLGAVVDYLQSLGISIGGYIPSCSVHIDSNGQLYNTQPTSMNPGNRDYYSP